MADENPNLAGVAASLLSSAKAGAPDWGVDATGALPDGDAVTGTVGMYGFAVTLPLASFDIRSEILLLGVITGLVYGLLGVALALVYKATRVINFAVGEAGALGALTVAVLGLVAHLPYPLALAGGLGVAAATGWLFERLVVRRLERASRLVLMVATIGLSQVLLAVGAFMPRDKL